MLSLEFSPSPLVTRTLRPQIDMDEIRNHTGEAIALSFAVSPTAIVLPVRKEADVKLARILATYINKHSLNVTIS